MKKKIICLLLAGTMVFGISACGTREISDSSINLMAAYGKTAVGEKAETYDTAFKENYADFAVKVFQTLAESGKNNLISPLSVLTALTMTENGAANDTLSEMEQTLGGGVSVEEQCRGLTAFIESLLDSEKGHLYQANSIWFRNSDSAFHVKDSFLEKNAETFGADIYSASFDGQTVKDVNCWVNQETEGMVPEILGKIDDEAMMYLINAVAFEAEWEDTYESGQVRDGEFTRGDGTKETVSMMYSQEHRYLEDSDTTGFIKFYKEGYSFAAFLPKEGIAMEDYLAGFSGEKYLALVENPDKSALVYAAIPKFTSEYEADLSEVLCEMGMPLAFDSQNADFSGIGSYDGDNLYISLVLHKTYICVDELGTKAGAATAVEVSNETAALIEDPKYVTLNRPFVYAIVENETMLPVFIGVTEQVDET